MLPFFNLNFKTMNELQELQDLKTKIRAIENGDVKYMNSTEEVAFKRVITFIERKEEAIKNSQDFGGGIDNFMKVSL